ncbi:FkbM family methyltransferase [bacterium]|nr:FkbM family methyltransferase [bacterium]
MKKILTLTLLKKFYQKGIVFPLSWLFWKAKFLLFTLFKIKKITSKYKVKLYSNYSDSTFHYYFCGSYGVFLSDLLSSIDKKFSFIDVGANQGLYSILSAKNPQCKKVVAFEPVDQTFHYLNKNILLNNVEQKCFTYNKAVDKAPGTKNIYYDSSHTGVASLAITNNSKGSPKKIETINFNFLNQAFSDLYENIYLKVDVEGHELTVLQEIFKTDKSYLIQGIFYEVDTRWVDPTKLKKLLSTNGFSNFQKIGNSNSHYDVFATK